MTTHTEWAAKGFATSLLPVIPPLVRMSPNSRVPLDQRGKVPGMLGGGGWFSYNWREKPASPEDLAAWQRMGAGVGVRCDAFPGWDIDVSDAGLAQSLRNAIESVLGPTSPRIGRPPRMMLPCRCEAGALRGWVVKWRTAAGETEMVDLRAAGMFYVLDGMHPRGKPYAWPEGRPESAAALPLLTNDLVAQCAATVLLVLDLFDIEPAAVSQGGAGGAGGGRGTVDQAGLLAPSEEALREALAAFDPPGDRDTWIKCGIAIKAAGGTVEDWQEWSDRWSGGAEDAADLERRWAGFSPLAVGWPWIELQARGAGWTGGAAIDFAGVAVPQKAVSTTLPAASAASGTATLHEMNRTHVFVMIGGKARIARDDRDAHGHRAWSYSAPADLKQFYRPRPMPGPKAGCRVDAWMGMADRRTARGITFAPGEPDITEAGFLNEWRGFAVRPDSRGSCERFKDHVRRVICQGDEGHFRYFWRWLAHLAQRPAEKPGVAVVLRGAKGAGKTIVGGYMAAILGRHATKVSNRDHLLGHFNAHLAVSLFVQVEEAIWAGDKAAEGALKDLITSDEALLERKGVDAVPIPSFQRFLFTSNEGLNRPGFVGGSNS